MPNIRHVYSALLHLCGTIAGLILATIAALVSVDVVIRNFGLGNMPWLLEVAEYALYVATFLAAPWVLHQGAHVRVDLLLTSLPAAAARRLEQVVDVIGLGVSAVFFYYGLKATLDAFATGAMIYKELIVPEWWLLAVLPSATFLMSVEFLRRLFSPSVEGKASEMSRPTDGL